MADFSTGELVGIIVGSIAGFFLLLFVFLFFLRRYLKGPVISTRNRKRLDG